MGWVHGHAMHTCKQIEKFKASKDPIVYACSVHATSICVELELGLELILL